MPEKHISLAESIIGLGAFLLAQLDKPKSVDQLNEQVRLARDSGTFPAIHDFDSVMLAISFLYSVGAIEATQAGGIRKCAS